MLAVVQKIFQDEAQGKPRVLRLGSFPSSILLNRRYVHSGGGDDGGLEAGAVGLALGEGQEAVAGTGDLTVAVVASAGALLEDRAQGKGGEREDDGGLHFENGLLF
jgi:hypothetical protein